jgi:uncharacterized membrane protein YtjA (UPF0391 family)
MCAVAAAFEFTGIAAAVAGEREGLMWLLKIVVRVRFH